MLNDGVLMNVRSLPFVILQGISQLIHVYL